MNDLLGEEAFRAYEAALALPYAAGLRANEMKIDARQLVAGLPYVLEPVPWVEGGFYYDSSLQPAKDPYYHAGLFYIQEPSAMTPAAMLPIEPGDRVLDLCAAPGGKSTQIGARLKGTGVLVSNDISASRAKGLVKNIELFGICNALVTSEAPEKLCHYFEGYFDKILVDAPCSGEGMFRKEPGMMKNWEDQDYTHYAALQREILPSAVRMLKAGGTLVYSTCTFSPEENEEQILWLLAQYPELSLEELPHPAGIDGGVRGMDGVMRLWPQRLKGEGHFVARIRKRENGEVKLPAKAVDHALRPSEKTLQPYLEFERELLNLRLDTSRMMLLQERLFLLPKDLPNIGGLRVLKSGWYLGDLEKGRFEPSQHFAMGLFKDEVKKTIDLPRTDERVLRYLKGETLDLAVDPGYHLVMVDGHALGWAKGAGNRLKNKYSSSWRYQ